MKTLLLAVIQSIYVGVLIWGLGGGKVGTRSRVWSENWMEWVAWRFHAVTKLHLTLLQVIPW